MKEYIEVYDKNGQMTKMEVIFTYNDKTTNNNYIVYKEDNNSNCYVAKFDPEAETTNLDTNLSEKELAMLNSIYEEIKGGIDVNN